MSTADRVRGISAVDAVDAVPMVTPPHRDDGREHHRRREQARWRASWERALDDLELDVDEAEALLAEERRNKEIPVVKPWSPPADLGPLPLDLRPRADAILQRQIAVAQHIATALVGNRRQAAALSKIETGGNGSSPRPVYLDYSM